MYRNFHELFILTLSLTSLLASSSQATAYPGPNLCPPVMIGEAQVDTTLILYAETSDRYINVCENPEDRFQNFYISRLKSGGNTIDVPFYQTEDGWSSDVLNEYRYIISLSQKKLFVYRGEDLILSQTFLDNYRLYE